MVCKTDENKFVVQPDGSVALEVKVINATDNPPAPAYELYMNVAGDKDFLAESYSEAWVGDLWVKFIIPKNIAVEHLGKMEGTYLHFKVWEQDQSGNTSGRDCSKEPGSEMGMTLRDEVKAAILNNSYNPTNPPSGACPGGCTSPATCNLIQYADPNDPGGWRCIDVSTYAGTTTSSISSDQVQGTCNDLEIETALGCIPYKADAFVPALLTFIIGITGGTALILMIVGAVIVTTGGSNPEQVAKGKEIFSGAITGLLFIIFSAAALRIIAGDIIKLPGF